MVKIKRLDLDMSTEFNINEVIERKEILNELEFERALIAERKLKILSKDNPKFKSTRKKLRDLIYDYENKNWSSESNISKEKLKESDIAEIIAEQERLFIEKRKALIKSKLKSLNMSQQDLGKILGHSSKTYMSELINGVCPFTIKDLVIINRILKIKLSDLITKILPDNERNRIKISIKKLGNPKVKLSKNDLVLEDI